MAPCNFSDSTRFLLVRPDRIGDLILTLPAVESLRKKYPNAFIGFLTRNYTAPLLKHYPSIDLILESDHPESSFLNSVEEIKSHHFDVAIHFYVSTRTALLTFISGIPVRIGPFSKFPSLLLNRRVTQNRSRVEKHEAEYNLDLVKLCGADGLASTPEIYLNDSEKRRGKEIISAVISDVRNRPFLIHPGSGGTVENWPLNQYIDLSQKIAGELGDVVITGGNEDREILETIKHSSPSFHPRIHVIPAGSLTLRELASVIANSRVVLSNSTGPLHMAVSLGIPTLSFYPKLPLVTSAKRWGPFSTEDIHYVLSPQNQDDPMSSISVDTAYYELKKLIANNRASSITI